MKRLDLLIFLVPSILGVACGETVQPELAEDERAVVIQIEPELFWGQDRVCWDGDPERCDLYKMLVGSCDNRNPGPIDVTNPLCAKDTKPFSMVGRVTPGCTGSLIFPGFVLTAAHCVTEGDGTLKPNTVTFSPWQYNVCPNGCPGGTIGVKRVYVPKRYRSSISTGPRQQKAFDLAILELERSVPSADTFPLLGPVPNSDLQSSTLYSLGYPGDLGTGKLYTVTGSYLGRTTHNGGTLMNTTIDGARGQSGSPVYIFKDGQRHLAGVLIGSPVDACEQGQVWAPKLTQWIYDNFIVPSVFSWMPGMNLSEVDRWNVPNVPAYVPPTAHSLASCP